MDHEILFAERQRFKQWWLWVILLAVNALLIFGLLKQVKGGQKFGDKPMSDTGLLITVAFTILVTIFIISLRLDTKIKKEGVYIKFFPFHLSFRRYTWTQITRAYVRRYKPIAEYGGWGLRAGLFGKGKAFNVSGDKGLQLEFSSNKRILIGTNKPDELTAALKKIGQLKT